MIFLRNVLRVLGVLLCLALLLGMIWLALFYQAEAKDPEGTLVRLKAAGYEVAA